MHTLTVPGNGRVQASESDLWARPVRGYRAGTRRGVLYSHHSGGTGKTPLDWTNNAGTARLCEALAANYAFASSDLGGSALCGNTTAQTRLGQLDAWCIASGTDRPRASTAPRIAVGVSGGVTALVNYYGTSPGHVADLAALVLILPLWDLDYAYQTNPSGVRAVIEAAWGVTHPTALPAGADPRGNTTLIGAANIPTRIYYASDDPLYTAQIISDMVAAFGNQASAVNVGALGHTDAAIAAIDRAELVSWLRTVAP